MFEDAEEFTFAKFSRLEMNWYNSEKKNPQNVDSLNVKDFSCKAQPSISVTIFPFLQKIRGHLKF